jgi:hypothetical protein
MKPPLTTAKELTLVKESILIPMVLEQLQQHCRQISLIVDTPKPYEDLIEEAMRLATMEQTAIKKSLRIHGIKVYEEERLADSFNTRFVCRGYHDKFSMLWDTASPQIQIRIRRYLGLPVDHLLRDDLPEHILACESHLRQRPPYLWPN